MNARKLINRMSPMILVMSIATLATVAGITQLTACSDFEPAPDIRIRADAGNVPEDEGAAPREDAVVDTGAAEDEGTVTDYGQPHVDFPDPEDAAVTSGDPGSAAVDNGTEPEDAGFDEGWQASVDTGVSPVDPTGCPGYVGCDCEQPEDCLSGLCAPTPDGHRCTRMCTTGDDCEPDETCRIMNTDQGPDAVYACLNRWPTACRPCVDDADCEAAWLDTDEQPACVAGGSNNSFCAPIAQGATLECPEGYTVERVELDRGWSWICVPDAGECPCTDAWKHPGYEMNCSVTNEFGTCTGTRLCHQECPASMPAGETCDGQDNDCDGTVDDGINGTACPITNAIGTCTGHAQCANGVEICLGAEATTERCDGIDNDCDGFTDEDLGQTWCGVGRCSHMVDNCIDGHYQICNPLQGASTETCDGIDEDCDGRTDEELGDITCGLGICAKTVHKCVAGKPQQCVPYPALQVEKCDMKDNDCDGLTDEGYGVVTCGVGPCRHTVDTCNDGVPDTCDPYEGATMEICNGFDEDCDGHTDNGIAYAANLMEPNNSLGAAINLGDVFEGDPTRSFEAMIYPSGDTDYFAFEAVEGDHSCPLGWDQDYKITVTLFNPTGPHECPSQSVALYNAAGAVLAFDPAGSCLTHTLEYKWDGECGPDDSRDFFVKIWSPEGGGVSCLPYKLNLTMTKI